MGLWSTIKGWFSSGVKVRLEDVPDAIHVGTNTIGGRATLAAKADKQVLKVVAKVVHVRKYKKDDEDREETKVLGEQRLADTFDIKADEERVFDFVITYHLDETLADMGGMLGAAGKIGNFFKGDENAYSVIVEADVKGTILDPSASHDVKVKKKEEAPAD